MMAREGVIVMPVEIETRVSHPQLPTAQDMCDWVELTLRNAAEADALERDLCVCFVSEEDSRQLNSTYRGIDKPTNVLSFGAGDDATLEATRQGASFATPLGDLAICTDVLAKEAQDQGKRLADHTAHLIVHGVLHLLGHDHEIPTDAQVMEALEVSLLAQIGVDDPYKEEPTGEGA